MHPEDAGKPEEVHAVFIMLYMSVKKMFSKLS
jgi:hypothetical protein